MNKILLSIVATATISLFSFGQAPEGFKYQAIVRDVGNVILNNQAVGMRMTIQQGTIGGTVVYEETFTTISNAYGLVNLEIGSGATSDDFSAIDWANGPYFMETAVDVTGGTSFTVMGTSQLMSVPYALYAKTSGSSTPGPQGPAGADGLSGTNGSNGFDGAPGPQGIQGVAGNDGAAGATGPQGPAGTNGTTGLDGAQGPQGIQGVAGNDGAVGATGPQGPAGTNGTTGLDGAQGPQGIQGVAGNDGPQGTSGNNGVSGYEQVFQWFGPVSASTVGNHTCNCPVGKVVVGGGYWFDGGTGPTEAGHITLDRPAGINAWQIVWYNKSGSSLQMGVYAICVNAN